MSTVTDYPTATFPTCPLAADCKWRLIADSGPVILIERALSIFIGLVKAYIKLVRVWPTTHSIRLWSSKVFLYAHTAHLNVVNGISCPFLLSL